MNLTTGTGSGGDAQGDTLLNIEDLLGNGFGDTLTGNAGANVINGGAGADIMQGLGGNDTYYRRQCRRPRERGGGRRQRPGADERELRPDRRTGDRNRSRRQTAPATGAINLTGNDFAQTITGNAGANVINGGGGADIMHGLGGNDTYYVDNAGDVVNEAAGGGNDQVLTSVELHADRRSGDRNRFSTTNSAGTGAINLTGNDFAQTIIGNAGANVIDGGGGDDILLGLGGNDTYYVDNAGDVVNEAAGGGNDQF